MKKLNLFVLMVLLSMSVAMAQTTPPSYFGGDVLGAHNGYGRGCVMCHTPHSGALGNGAGVGKDSQNGMYALWGQDLTPLYGQTFSFSGDGSSTYSVTLPAAGTLTSAHDANTVILFCLSCHDGVLTKAGVMQGHTVEALPRLAVGAPTLLAQAAPSAGKPYSNDHPVGGYANVGCGGQYNWDCTGGGNTNTPIQMNGAASAQFLVNYPGSFWNSEKCTTSAGTTTCSGNPLSSFGGTTVNAVTCTTCHDQHSMTVWTVGGKSYTTMFFVRGAYNPYSGGNNVAQFCRNCHGGESNEMHGLTSVPTT